MGSGGRRFGFPAIPTKWGNVSPGPSGLGDWTQGHTHPPHPPPRALSTEGSGQPAPQKPLRRATHPSRFSILTNLAAKEGAHRPPHPNAPLPAPSPSPDSPSIWMGYIPPALPDVSIPVSIPSFPDRAIIYQVVSRVVREEGPGGRGFVSSLCWSSTGPSSLVSSQLLRVARVHEQMLKGLPFICRLILLPFHFILPGSGMLLVYARPPPSFRLHVFEGAGAYFPCACLFFSPSAASPITNPLSLGEFFYRCPFSHPWT